MRPIFHLLALGRLGVALGRLGVALGRLGVSGYQHVGIGNAKSSRLGSRPTRDPT